jgi:hypothetical protein
MTSIEAFTTLNEVRLKPDTTSWRLEEDSAVLHRLPAEPALDTEMAVRDVVVERRCDTNDVVLLDVELQRAADTAVGADRVGDGLLRLVPRPACRMSCSDLNISAPVGQTPMQLPQ